METENLKQMDSESPAELPYKQPVSFGNLANSLKSCLKTPTNIQVDFEILDDTFMEGKNFFSEKDEKTGEELQVFKKYWEVPVRVILPGGKPGESTVLRKTSFPFMKAFVEFVGSRNPKGLKVSLLKEGEARRTKWNFKNYPGVFK